MKKHNSNGAYETRERAKDKNTPILLEDKIVEVNKYGEVIYLNDHAAKFFETLRVDLLGKIFLSAFPGKHGKSIKQALESVWSKNISSRVRIYDTGKKQWLTFEIIPSSSGAVIVITVDDFQSEENYKDENNDHQNSSFKYLYKNRIQNFDTQKTWSQNQYKDAMDLLIAILNSSLHPLTVFEPVKHKNGEIVDFRLLFNNQSADLLMGKGFGENLVEFHHFIKGAEVNQKFTEVLKTGVTSKFEIQYVYENLKSWYEITAVKLMDKIVVTVLDITEQKMSEQSLHIACLELEWSNATIESMLDGSLVCICLLESLRDQAYRITDFIFKAVNKSFEAVPRKNKTTLSGKLLLEEFPEFNILFFEEFRQVVETGIPFRVEQ